MTDSKAHLRRIFAEVMLLLLALLLYDNWFLPTMIRVAARPVGVQPHDVICIRVVPASAGQARLAFGSELALGLRTADDRRADDADDAAGLVEWGGTPQVRTAKVRAAGQRVTLVAALVSLDGVAPDDLRRPVRLVVFRDADQLAVHDEIAAGALGPDRLVLTLSPANRYQAEVELPPALLEKSSP